MFDEPRRHRRFMLILALVALGTVPFPFAGRELVMVLGIPLWLWSSAFATTALSALTAWGVLRLGPRLATCVAADRVAGNR